MYDLEHEDETIEEFTNELDCLKYVKKDLTHVKCFFLYVNIDRKLSKINTKEIKLQIPNTILKNDLVKLIKSNNKLDNRLYKLVYMLKYNFNIDEKDLKNLENYCFLDTIDTVEDISFYPTVEVMTDINSLYFVYLDMGLKKKTKKNLKLYIYQCLNQNL